jgi:HlyD family secretion protein
MKRGYVWGGVVVALAAVAYLWLRSPSEATDNLLERTAIVERGDLVVSISASGVIQPVEKVEVKSKASGEIIVLAVQEGDVVKRGQLVARLDPVTVQNEFDQVEADFKVAEVTREQRQTELNRQQDLFNRNLSSKSELDNARLAYEESGAALVRARAALATARERLEDTEIKAPIDGIVLSRPVEAGQIISSGTTTVTGGTLLCTIANMSRVYVVALVDETDIGRVAVGLRCEVRPEAYPSRQLHGEVLRIAPQAKVEQNVTMFEVTCVVDNEDGLLKAGMNATVEMVLAQADDVLTLPVRALSQDAPVVAETASGQSAPPAADSARARPAGARANGKRGPGRNQLERWVQVQSEGKREWKKVSVGLNNLDRIEIASGLAEGDTVVYQLVSGALQARDEFRDRMRDRGPAGDMRRGGS